MVTKEVGEIRGNLTPVRVIWLLILLCYSLVEWVLGWFEWVRNRWQNLRSKDQLEQRAAGQSEERQLKLETGLVEYGVRPLAKVPSHLVVMLGPEEPDYRLLAKFIFWGMAAGVGHVSFYDHRGTLKRNHHEMLNFVSRQPRSDSEQIVWTPQLKTAGGLLPPRNGYRRRVVVSFFSPEDGKRQLVATAQSISQSLQAGQLTDADQITTELVDRKLQERFHHIPDPELALYYGSLCATYGMLPWHIRLTEFVPLEVPSLGDTRPRHFLDCLYRYARCEQRFGK